MTHLQIPSSKSFPELLANLDALSGASPEVVTYRENLRKRLSNLGDWTTLAGLETYRVLASRIPKFLYFSDYYILPGKANLAQIVRRNMNGTLQPSDRTVMALLRMANADLQELTEDSSYNELRDRLDDLSNEITKRVFAYWRQNDQLAVTIDVRPDPTDDAPFDDGPNLYIGITDKRHSITIPFEQRSRGFVWFFSFLVWFDSVQEQSNSESPLILLLDEPGLSLHASAQADFLSYIENLGESNQVVYTTHSPFMVKSDSLDRVRVVEDRGKSGTSISERLDGSDPRSIFPLQAALGYTIAQNLFIAERNLLVEGPADLIYLQAASAALEALGRESLDPGIVLVPIGGLNNISSFVALLSGNQLKFAVLTDHPGKLDQRIEALLQNRVLPKNALLDFSMFRAEGTKQGEATDIEDLFTPLHYLRMFSEAYKKAIPEGILVSSLPKGKRIVQRIDKYLESSDIKLRIAGGFNHYHVAVTANSKGIDFEPSELDVFQAIFSEVNKRFSPKGKKQKH